MAIYTYCSECSGCWFSPRPTPHPQPTLSRRTEYRSTEPRVSVMRVAGKGGRRRSRWRAMAPCPCPLAPISMCPCASSWSCVPWPRCPPGDLLSNKVSGRYRCTGVLCTTCDSWCWLCVHAATLQIADCSSQLSGPYSYFLFLSVHCVECGLCVLGSSPLPTGVPYAKRALTSGTRLRIESRSSALAQPSTQATGQMATATQYRVLAKLELDIRTTNLLLFLFLACACLDVDGVCMCVRSVAVWCVGWLDR